MTHLTNGAAMEVAVEARGAGWKTLYWVGAAAPLVALVFYLIQAVVIGLGEPFPATTESLFSLLERNRFLGLLYLNALDIFSITFLGIMFLALNVALRDSSKSTMLIATYLALAGVVAFVVPRVAMISVLPISDQYAAATTDAQREMLLAAGETLTALGVATPQTIGFLFMAVAGAISHLSCFGPVSLARRPLTQASWRLSLPGPMTSAWSWHRLWPASSCPSTACSGSSGGS